MAAIPGEVALALGGIGGFTERGLSDGALDWMLGRIESVDLARDQATIQAGIDPDPLDLIRDDARRPPPAARRSLAP